MNSNFIHLHVHSHYSLLDGLSKIEQLVQKAKDNEMSALALTDHGVMYGAIELYQKCKKAGIKPIIGCETYIAPRSLTDKQPRIDTKPHHLVLLAKNRTGYDNLVMLVTKAHLEGFYYKPRIDKELLKKHSEGLIAMTACLHGEIPKLLTSNQYDKAKEATQFYIDTFGKENLFLELQYHPELPDQKVVNDGLIKLAKEFGLGLVATNDSHYLDKEDAEAHEVLLSVQTGKDIDDKDRLSMGDVDLSFADPKTMAEHFKDTPEAISNTLKIAEMCNLEMELGKPILPKFELPEGQTSMGFVEELARKGFKNRYPDNSMEAQKRLDYELSVIGKTGFADYFLIVQDFINWAKNNGVIVGPGRGSAAGSIVAYCINITDLDPLKYGLLFERFLNPERISMPDIDVDFADDRLDKVIEYVQEKYGEDHVAQIITFGTMAARGSVRDTARAFGMNYADGDRISKLIPTGYSIDKALGEVKELKQIYNNEPSFKKLIDMAKKLEGVARHASTHACGVVISKDPLTKYLPLQSAQKGSMSITTQYPMGDVDAIGLLKMDFLGLSNLTIIKNAIRIVKKTKDENIDISKISMDDKKTYELLSKGETTGVFQLESDGMKRYIKELKPSEIDDIIAMVALYRPGPLEFIPDYIAGKHGRKKVKYLHPKLEPILNKTYGIAVYQEQVMQIARELAGFTMGEADVLRKAVGKKIKKLLDEQKEKLLNGMVKNGIKKETAEKIWKFIEPFASYGFNKSHAACYALIAYQTAYLKAHYPSEFMAALLTSDFQNLDRVAIEISECERMGTKVLPPNINDSFVEFGVKKESGNVTFALAAIKNVGLGVAEAIVEERKNNGSYASIEDFITRLGTDVINKKSMESLAKAGALDCLAERNLILNNMEMILRFSSSLHKQISKGQMGLFGQGKENTVATSLKLIETAPADKKQRLAWERELLGIYVSEHPLDDIKDLVAKAAKPIASLSSETEGKRVKAAGIVSTIQKIITRSNEPMIFAKLEDMTSQVEVLVFPKLLKQNPLIWEPDNIIIVEGKLSMKDGQPKILADTVKPLDEKNLTYSFPDDGKYLYITLNKDISKDTLLKIKDVLAKNPGKEAVVLIMQQNGDKKEVRIKDKVNISEKIKEELAKVIGKNNIKVS